MKPNDTDKNMNPTKEGRNHWRKRLSSQYTCFNAAHADFTIRLLDALEEADRGRLEWTDDPPKVPGGGYWCRDENDKENARIIFPNIRKTKWRDKQWAGPIPKPREPK